MIPFPFSAIVGQERMKLALLLAAVNPRIGGVLIVGGRGSAKSSAARALAALLPPLSANRNCPAGCDPLDPCELCGEVEVEERPTPFVALPLGATEDRVVGTLDLERALRRGEKRFEPGLLARAHRGILYVDEVNLLPDHLVDLLLDVAASGVAVVEREGVSVRHPSRFILVGTMNPEEGELRPQLLDRFGLLVASEDLADPRERAEAAARVTAFEVDPVGFRALWAPEEERLRARLLAARAVLPRVRVPGEVASEIATRCCREGVEGLRADLVIRKASSALAAWEGREAVTVEDVDRVSEYALAHRRRSARSAPPLGPAHRPPPAPPPRGPDAPPSGGEAGRDDLTPVKADPLGPLRLPASRAPGSGSPGTGTRPDRAAIGGPRGPCVTTRLPRGNPLEVALGATLRAAAGRQPPGLPGPTAVVVRTEDLREKVRRAPVRHLFLVVLDASRSMGAHRRMELTKGILLGLLEESYRKRDEVGLITFRGGAADVVLPPTRSVRRVQRAVEDLPIGGRTPLAQALEVASQVLRRARRRAGAGVRSVILVSDGRPTVGHGSLDPVHASEEAFLRLLRHDARILLVTTEPPHVPVGLLPAWAARWNLPCITLEELGARRVRQLLGG